MPGGTRVTGTLAESYCCPTSAHRPPRWLAMVIPCVDPVLSVPDSSAPSPPGPSGSGLFAGYLIPPLGQRELALFRFGDALSRHSGAREARVRNPLGSELCG